MTTLAGFVVSTSPVLLFQQVSHERRLPECFVVDCSNTGSYAVTLTSVGYGDLTVSQDPRWRSFIGSMYMILSVLVAAVAFSAAADAAVSPFENFIHEVCVFVFGKERPNEFLYKQIRRTKFIKLGEITVQFFLLNLLGVFASRVAIRLEDGSNPDVMWTWMVSNIIASQAHLFCLFTRRECPIISPRQFIMYDRHHSIGLCKRQRRSATEIWRSLSAYVGLRFSI